MASTIKVNTLDTQSGTDVTITAGKAITGANTQFKITGGSNLNHLSTDGSGNLDWVAQSGGGGGGGITTGKAIAMAMVFG